MADVKIRVIGEDDASDELKKVDSSLQGFGSGLGDAAKFAGEAAAAIAIVGGTMKKAFDLGREGAVIDQINESFTRLVDSSGAANDTLQQLMNTAKGTIDDEELMSATMRLVAGTSEELTKSLLGVSPQILEMAKAANKLNPTMGTTVDQYERLIMGIRTGSERMLRQSGIMVDFQKSYEDYADILGKDVKNLTEEERVAANLNAVLGQQNTLIQQVGGNTDSAADAFDRLSVSFGDLKDNALTKLAPGLTAAAEALNTLLTWDQKVNDAFNQHSEDVLKSSSSYAEYAKEMERAAIAAGKMSAAQGNMGKGTKSTAEEIPYLTEAEYNAAKAIDNLNQSNAELSDGHSLVAQATQAATDATIGQTDAVITDAQALSDLKTLTDGMTFEQLSTSLDTNKGKFIDLKAAADQVYSSLLSLTKQTWTVAINVSVGGGTAETQSAITDLVANALRGLQRKSGR